MYGYVSYRRIDISQGDGIALPNFAQIQGIIVQIRNSKPFQLPPQKSWSEEFVVVFFSKAQGVVEMWEVMKLGKCLDITVNGLHLFHLKPAPATK